MTPVQIDKQLLLLRRLRGARIHAQVRHTRDDAISVDASVPGQRWEIDILEDGSIEVEVFKSDGQIHDAAILEDMIETFADTPPKTNVANFVEA